MDEGATRRLIVLRSSFNNLAWQCLTFAIDRQKLIDTVPKGGQKPAKTFACSTLYVERTRVPLGGEHYYMWKAKPTKKLAGE